MFESSLLELSSSALRQNLSFIRGLLPERCTLSSVVKGNAYGHGILEFVGMACAAGVEHFSTYSAEEAFTVKGAVPQGVQIAVMGDVEGAALEWVITAGVSFWVFDLERLRQALNVSKRTGHRAKVHLEIETGMNRNGLAPAAVAEALEMVRNHPQCIELVGVCSHLAGAESISNHYRIQRQREAFSDALNRFAGIGFADVSKHLACSAAVIRYPDTCLDLARVGIMQYGFFPTREIRIEYLSRNPNDVNPLQRVLTWRSQVMTTFSVDRGEFVGYGMSFQASEPMRLATVPVGYSHGFSRSLSNLGSVLIRGQRAPVVGVVNMNQITVNVTHIEHVQRGDDVVLIGCQGEEEITVSSFSDVSSQVNYELLTRLPLNIPRRVV